MPLSAEDTVSRTLALLTSCLVLAGRPALGQRVAGTWDAEMNTPGAVVSFQFVFTVKGDTLQGTVLRSSGEVPLRGSVKGDSLWFSYTIDYNNNSLLISMAGRVVGDSLFGTVDFNGQAQDQFWAHRRQPPPAPGNPELSGPADVRPPAAVPIEGDQDGIMQEVTRLDLAGQTTRARVLIQGLIDSAASPASRATAQRAMAMSYAFDGDCANTIKYETMVIDYWKTREQAEPQNAFYQEGEMANEGARVCVDAGDLATAERWYRLGYQFGLKEPEPRTHPVSLWDFRLAHALGRIAARRGDAVEAKRQVANARRALDGDSAMAAQQERFFPYLVGYVALYTNDLTTAEAEFTRLVAMPGNQRDPFMRCLLAMTLEKLGRTDEANAMYRQAYDLATGHNPPAAYVRPLVRRKLGL
jgi:hypothetical protein